LAKRENREVAARTAGFGKVGREFTPDRQIMPRSFFPQKIAYDEFLDLHEQQSRAEYHMFREVDHIAIVVHDTNTALKLYRDQMRLPVLFSEELAGMNVRLTHLDMGNVRLQLVQPLTDDHPLQKHLAEHGESLHHVCWKLDNIDDAIEQLADFGLEPNPNEPHSAPNGGRAAFVNPAGTNGVLWEMTGR